MPLTSRRKFIGAAIATGGAGILSAELTVLSARGNAETAAQIVLPAATEDVTPFKVSVPQSAIDDLKRRLASTRWPERETVGDWSQGVPLQKAQALVGYWRDKYDWRRFEARINAFPQYRTQIDGVGIHFIHVRSPQQNALPIILTHGWPGSVVEFMEVIGPLSDPTRYGGRFLMRWGQSPHPPTPSPTSGEGEQNLPSPLVGISLPRTFVLAKDVLRYGAGAGDGPRA